MRIAISLLGIEFFALSFELAPSASPRPREITGGSSHNFERLPDEEWSEPVEDFGFTPIRARN